MYFLGIFDLRITRVNGILAFYRFLDLRHSLDCAVFVLRDYLLLITHRRNRLPLAPLSIGASFLAGVSSFFARLSELILLGENE